MARCGPRIAALLCVLHVAENVSLHGQAWAQAVVGAAGSDTMSASFSGASQRSPLDADSSRSSGWLSSLDMTIDSSGRLPNHGMSLPSGGFILS